MFPYGNVAIPVKNVTKFSKKDKRRNQQPRESILYSTICNYN